MARSIIDNDSTLEDAIDEAIDEDLNTLSFTVDSNGYLDLDVNIEKGETS